MILPTRKTSAGNQVYKITITKRDEVEAFLLAIQPYVVGNLFLQASVGVKYLLKLMNLLIQGSL